MFANVNDIDIIEAALDRMNQMAGVRASAIESANTELDAVVELNWHKTIRCFHVEVKYELRHLHLQKLELMAQSHSPFLLIAYRLFPRIKEQLREARINYLEANGNMHVHEPNLYIDIDRFEILPNEKKEVNRAFTKTGLKVVFQLLTNDQLLDASHRRKASEAQVALGNIPLIMKGLLDGGFVVRKERGYVWANKLALIQQWVLAYNTTLRPSLARGTYALQKDSSLKNLEIRNDQTCWGGEPAAEHYTQYLRPEMYTVYTKQRRSQAMAALGLKPDPKGSLEIFEKFWPQAMKTHYAPPLLVYADLINAPNKRNLETAEKILNDHVQGV
jgi:hypothetical protein